MNQWGYCDDKSALSIVHNLVYQGRRKHVKVDRNFAKEKLDSGLFYILFISSHGNLVMINLLLA